MAVEIKAKKGEYYFNEEDNFQKESKPKNKIVLMNKFSPVPYAQIILDKLIIKYDSNKTLWRYDYKEGVWKEKAEQYLRSLIRKQILGEEQQIRNYVEEIISHIKDVCYDPTFEVNNNPYLIAFNNGVFDLRDEVFKDFSPEFHITNKIPRDILESQKECPKIDKFFEESLGKEYKDILYDLCSYCLFKRYPYPKLFFIYGPANTGKSKFLELLERFLGENNYCSVEPQDIQKDTHATAQMQYKMANIVSDINYDALDNINQVKKIVGEDSVKIRNMYKEPYNARLYAKQIFSTNKLPVVKEKTRAWYRRVYTIEFSNIVENSKVDRFIMEKLTTEEELNGLAYKCLEHLKELKKYNFTFSYDIDQNEMQKTYEKLSNPILLFIDENCVENKKDYLFQWEFKDRLKSWLKANHFPPISTSEINEYMKENYTSSNRETFPENKIYRVWVGLSWKKLSENSQNNEFNRFNQVGRKVYISRQDINNPVKSVKFNKIDGKLSDFGYFFNQFNHFNQG